MPWPVHPTGFFGARGDNDSYRIERSLRFNSADSAYLNRTMTASFTSQRIFTFSFWCKRGSLSSAQSIFDRNQSTNVNQFAVGFNSNDTFAIAARTSGTSTIALNLATSAVFRDPSAWYHFVIAVDNTQATLADRGKIYVNGVLQSLGTQTATQNVDYHLLSGLTYDIGRTALTSSQYFDGYLTEFNFIDGQALTPSSFGETDSITGRWKAKAYSGTYGTNGFYLKFADNSGTTDTTLGKDSSGNGNNWTPNNFSVTAGVNNDSVVDTPTNYGADNGLGGEARGNYCTLNPNDAPTNGSFSITDGNLKSESTSAANRNHVRATFALSYGKWYFEVERASGDRCQVGIVTQSANKNDFVGFDANGWGIYQLDGNKFTNNTGTAYGSAWSTAGDVLMVAFDADNGKLFFGKNGTWFASGDPAQGTNAAFTGLTSGPYFPAIGDGSGAGVYAAYINFGQRPFAYTAPTGFKALCTTNLPQPIIQKPSRYMDVVAYTGTGASNSISSLGFSPDLVWIKNRGTTTSHAIYDTTRGSQNQLSSDTTGDAVTSSSGLTVFGSNGFTIGTSSLVNTSGTQYVAWAWDEAPIAGLDIVSYTGNGANRTISHNLGVAPKMLVVKARTTAGADQGWPVWHTSIANTTYLTLSTTSATATGTDYWNSTSPTASVFSLGTNAAVNTNNDTYIAYLFAEVEGFSKFGSYTGNGLADGPFVWCGFRPRWVMMKRIDAAGKPWCIHDTARDIQNVSNSELEANSATAENGGTYPGDLDILSNGFKPREGSSAWINESGTYIFAAFAESPFKYARAR